MKLIISGGRILDPKSGTDGSFDVVVENDRVLGHIRPGEPVIADRRIDASGLLVVPGLVDMHVHLREPGQEHKETIKTGTSAAAAGGFSTIAAMPNTSPIMDSPEVIKYILDQSAESASVRVLPVAAMTSGSMGVEPCDFEALADAGAIGVSDDGRWVPDTLVMRRVLDTAFENGLLPISHAEDSGLSYHGAMNRGNLSERLGYPGIPSSAEDVAVFRDVKLAEATGRKLHIAHVSTAGAVEIIRRAKEAGAPVTAETAPHYFTLTEDEVESKGAMAKMNPPLRTEKDREEIIKGLADGTLDCIATDHAPHTLQDKKGSFDQAAFGIVGLETAVSLTLELVRSGKFSLERAIDALSTSPADILGVPGGNLAPGSPADITLIDPDLQWTVDTTSFKSKGRNTPFFGMALKGCTVMTIIGGRIVFGELPYL